MKTFDELIEAEAEKHGLAVAKHSWERGPLNNIDGSYREFNNRSDFNAKSAFRFGAKFVRENPTMIESVRELVEAAKDIEPGECDCGKVPHFKINKCPMHLRLSMVIKKLEKDL